MSYYLKYKDFTRVEYKRITEFDNGLVVMKQTGFIYLIIGDKDNKWENAVCLSTGQLEKREDIEKEYQRHGLGFKKVNGTVELSQTTELYYELEEIIAKKIGRENAEDVMKEISAREII